MDAQKISLVETESDKSKFCDAWPMVKDGLELLKKIIKNPIAVGAIDLIIKAGDAIAGTVCA